MAGSLDSTWIMSSSKAWIKAEKCTLLDSAV